LLSEKEILTKFLDSQDPTALTNSIEHWEDAEKDYWVNSLGKQAAIEILTAGKPSVETMTKMVKLPEELYIKSTQICVRLANAIKAATTAAEMEIGFADETEPTSPKKLLLKKVK
jgi:hypothetical protein